MQTKRQIFSKLEKRDTDPPKYEQGLGGGNLQRNRKRHTLSGVDQKPDFTLLEMEKYILKMLTTTVLTSNWGD